VAVQARWRDQRGQPVGQFQGREVQLGAPIGLGPGEAIDELVVGQRSQSQQRGKAGGGLKNDWIALIEASYSLDGSDQDWLDNLFDHAEPLLEQGMGRGAWTFRCTPTTFQVERYPTRTPKLLWALHRAAHAAAPERWFDLTYRSGDVVGTGSEKIYPRLPHTSRIVAGVTGGRARDVFMAGAQSGTALGVAFGVWLKEQRFPTTVERKRWPCVSAHLGAGLRLRAAARRLQLDAEPVEAVLDSGGRVHDARAGAVSISARESLREAVRRIERARTTEGRSDPDAAMDGWEGLVGWALVSGRPLRHRR
jgi:hypothetical protein